MFRRNIPVVILLIVLIMTASSYAEEQDSENTIREGRPRISVTTFDNPAQYYNSTIGNGITDMLITKLIQSGRFNVIARHESFDEVKDEIDLGASGYIEESTKVEKGHVKGVEYILMGKVTNFGYDESSTGIGGRVTRGFGDIDVSKQKANAWVDFRLVDARTGETILAESAKATESKSGIGLRGGKFSDWIGRVSFDSSEFTDSMVGKATVKAIDEIAEKLIEHFPLTGAIIAVAGNRVVIDLGKGAGIEENQIFKVVKVEELISSTGEIVFRDEVEIGEVKIVNVQLKSSMAEIISGCENVSEGDLVKDMDDSKKKDKK